MNSLAISLEAMQHMGPLRLTVTPREKGYVAKSSEQDITAFGKTAADAAENARKMAVAAIETEARPEVLLLRVDEPGLSTVIMQPLDRPVSLAATAVDVKRHYVATEAGDTSLKAAT
jgi:hypothetical protein